MANQNDTMSRGRWRSMGNFDLLPLELLDVNDLRKTDGRSNPVLRWTIGHFVFGGADTSAEIRVSTIEATSSTTL